MAELTVGTWDTLNSFGDEQLGAALGIVGQMDADVVYLGEMTPRDVDDEQLEAAQDGMRRLGYENSMTSDYSPHADVRNAHRMGMFSRIDGEISKLPIGKRWGLKLVTPDERLTVYGHHDIDLRHTRTERAETVDDIAEDLRLQGGEAIDLGDKNAMRANGPNARLPRTLGKLGVPKLLRLAGGMQHESDYYDEDQRLKRVAGKVIRVCEMADDETMWRYEVAGFHGADPDNLPTIGGGRMAFQIDHIQGTAGVSFESFRQVIESREVSDHTAIVARARY